MVHVTVPSSHSTWAVQDPNRWDACWKNLRDKSIRRRDQIVLSADVASPLHAMSLSARAVCCVRLLPRLAEVKSALHRMAAMRERTDSIARRDAPTGGTRRFDDSRGYEAQPPSIWSVNLVTAGGGGIAVVDAIGGKRRMHIAAPKRGVLVTALLHAPFRGLIDRRLEAIPIALPEDLLAVREASLIVSDYVWVGFADGAIRLLPADPQRVREQDRSVLLAKGDLADLVFELPKYHNAAIVAITRSPCHEDEKTTDLVTVNRLSHAIRDLTAATSPRTEEEREHLSLICTASEDSCIVVWDLRKIYRRLEEMRLASHSTRSGRFGMDPTAAAFRGDVVTFELSHPPNTVRSTCTMVKVRPLFKLKGSIGGLRTLNWVTTMVTTMGYEKPRDGVALTRDPKESTATYAIRERRAVQYMTRREMREEHRRMLRLSETDMREVEEELERLLPPLALEPSQNRRINLIVAGDAHGVVHMWDLDEELQRALDLCDVGIHSIPGTPCGSSRGVSVPHSPHSGRRQNMSSPPSSSSLMRSPPERSLRSPKHQKYCDLGTSGRPSAAHSVTRASVASPRQRKVAASNAASRTKRRASRAGAATGVTPVRLSQRMSHSADRLDAAWTVDWPSARSPPSTVGTSARSGRLSTGRSLCGGSRAGSRGRRSSERKETWQTNHQYVNSLYSRAAKCRMELTDGGSVTGISVDLPPIISVTMRRLPDAEERPYSLLEQPTDEEFHRRQLANTFHILDDERALFCVMERLQFFFSVDGTVMRMQCVPMPIKSAEAAPQVAPARRIGSGGRSKGNNGGDFHSNIGSGGGGGGNGSGAECGPTLRIIFRRHVLERHSQPIVWLFLDHARHHLWVARHDGLLSIFSTQSGAVVTRLPHPSADTPLGPPSAPEWRRQQRDMALLGGRPHRLEVHRECKGYPPAWFVDIAPVSVRQGFALMRVSLGASSQSTPLDVGGVRNGKATRVHSVNESLSSGGEDVPNGGDIVKLDGRHALDASARGREASLAELLQTLRRYRADAVSVRMAQRDYCKHIGSLLADRIGRLVAQCDSLEAMHATRRAFRVWRMMRDHFSRECVLRRLRHARLQRLSHAAGRMANGLHRQWRHVFFAKWFQSARRRRVRRMAGQFERAFALRALPTVCARVAAFLGVHAVRQRYWLLWRRAVAPPPMLPAGSFMSPRVFSPRAASAPFSPRAASGPFSPRSPRLQRASPSKPRGDGRDGVFADLVEIIAALNVQRQQLISFRFDSMADSVLDIDDLWIDTINVAVASVTIRTAHAVKLAVFKFSFLPLLEGLLSTAEEVLPHMLEANVREEVRSMICGCLQCLDYLHADADIVTGGAQNGHYITSVTTEREMNGTKMIITQTKSTKMGTSDSGGRHTINTRTLREREMRVIFDDAMDEREFEQQIDTITTQRAVIEELVRTCCIS